MKSTRCVAEGETQPDMNEESQCECATLSLLFHHNCAGKYKKNSVVS